MSEIVITRAPMGISLQDAGRMGYSRYGISEAGAMDWARHAMANRMLGKDLFATVIEIGPAGLGLSLESGSLQFSFAGPRFNLKINGKRIHSPARAILSEGQQLEITPESGAMWGYLGVQGEFDVVPYLGSHAQNSVSGMHAKLIRQGTKLSILDANGIEPAFANYVDPYIAYEHLPIGIIPSSQHGNFSAEMHQILVRHAMMVEPRFDRMAYRLKGEEIFCQQGHDILSDGITMGAIQVPGDGHPFVLMADHQTTGGYPKIACVCKADLPRMAQMSAGKPFMFCWQTVDESLDRWAQVRQQIESMLVLSQQRIY